jgi:hypothetical protein
MHGFGKLNFYFFFESGRFLTVCFSFSAVFTWTNLLVVVAELDGPENEALDLVPLITNTVLEEHHLIVGIVVIADPGTVPINSRGEKQRSTYLWNCWTNFSKTVCSGITWFRVD